MKLLQVRVQSQRNFLAYLAQLWDPIGLVSPTNIEFRIDLQELWSTGYSWDDIFFLYFVDFY